MYHQVVQKNTNFGVILKTNLKGLKKGIFFPVMVPGFKYRGLVHARNAILPDYICSLVDGI